MFDVFRAFRSIRVFYLFPIFHSLGFVLLLLLPAQALNAQQRAMVNPSFEDPPFALGIKVQYAEGAFPGWLTTHPITIDGCDNGTGNYNITCRAFERWGTGFNGVSTAPGAGNFLVEMNAYDYSMVYQNVCMANGESFSYSFLHRGRGGTDTAQFRIGIPTGLPPGSKPADPYSFPILQVSTTPGGGVASPPTGSGTINPPVAAGNGWVRYSGTYTYTGSTGGVNMGFVAISAAGGLSVGNFIDDWQIQLAPYIELSFPSGVGAEGNGGGSNSPANGPAVRIGGQVLAPVTATVQVTGGTATIGTDYSLTTPFQSGNTTNTLVLNIPPGTYDGVSAASIFPIPFSTSADNSVEPHESVELQLIGVTGALVSGIVSCGGVPTTIANYTISNDDFATAANVSVSGRVMTAGGSGLSGAVVSMTDSQGVTRTATTSPFGYYRFDEVQAGQTYLFNVSAKRYRFAPRIVTVGDELTDLNFTPQIE